MGLKAQILVAFCVMNKPLNQPIARLTHGGQRNANAAFFLVVRQA
jgi:hypothetical protein